MCLLNKCCCCVHLRSGGILLGITTLALSIFSIIPFTLSLINRVFLARVITRLVQKYRSDPASGSSTQRNLERQFETSIQLWGIVNGGIENEESDLPPADDERVEWLSYAMLIFYITSLILLAVYAIASTLLIIGSYKAKRWMICPWLFLTMIFIILYVIGMILSMLLVGVHIASVALLIIAIIEICIALYLWTAICSLYQAFGSPEYKRQSDWELKPRFTTQYGGVPTSPVD